MRPIQFQICKACLYSLLSFLLLTSQYAKAEMVLTMAADTNISKCYEQFLAQEKPIEEVTSLKSSIANRPVAEIILVQQALFVAGLPVEIKFIDSPNAARDISLVEDGVALMAGHTVFSSSITEELYCTEVVIPVDSFVKGVYTRSENYDLLRVKDLNELRKFSAISSTAWAVDWMTLQGLGLPLYSVPTYKSMIKMVGKRRGDFAVLEFPPSKDLSLKLFGIDLVPVPGIKIGIKDSRHFVVSKKHPDGAIIYEALERGLKILKKQGRIKRYLRDVGFFNDQVENWTLINPTAP